jgi:hypothetical protein
MSLIKLTFRILQQAQSLSHTVLIPVPANMFISDGSQVQGELG